MMRSLSSAVAGLRSHQTRMDVIGNNIANVNTYGFKSSRATFSDVYYQTLSSGSAPASTLGGVNPTQIGYGASIATIDVLNSQAGASSTDRALDIYISGDGMICTRDPNGNLRYSRLGILGFDSEGNLVDSSGNFVMGFPTDRNTGLPIINPDGTADIEDLSIIQIDPELLEQLTGISISNTGQITGTLAGDVEVSLKKASPDWITDISIAEDSNYVGDIKVTMERVSTTNDTPSANWITSITPAVNSGVAGPYSFEYDYGSRRIIATGPNGERYSGAYERGSTVEMADAGGNVVFTVVTDRYTEPTPGGTGQIPLGTLNYSMRYDLVMQYTDKGGNTNVERLEGYDRVTTTVTLGDVTLTIDPSLVEQSTQAVFGLNMAGPDFDDWLQNAYVDPESAYNGNVELRVGTEYTASFSGTATNSTLNWMDESQVKALMQSTRETGTFRISTSTDTATGGLIYTVTTPSGLTLDSNVITQYGQSITITGPDGNNYTIATYDQYRAPTSFSDLNAATGTVFSANTSTTGLDALLRELGGSGDYTLAYNGTAYTLSYTNLLGATQTQALTLNGTALECTIGSTTYTLGTFSTAPTAAFSEVIATATFQPGVSSSGSTLGNASSANKIYVVVNGVSRADATYTSGSTIKVGDLTLQVDPDALKTYFSGDPALTTEQIGEVLLTDYYDWDYSGTAASAQVGTGESIIVGQMVLAKIPNAAAMIQDGDSYFLTSANSGEATFVIPGLEGTGELSAGYLEMSNVDISKEFTDMITTQRGFQANSRIITVSDTMLEELVNLKR